MLYSSCRASVVAMVESECGLKINKKVLAPESWGVGIGIAVSHHHRRPVGGSFAGRDRGSPAA